MARKLLNEDAIFEVRETDLELTITPDPEALYLVRPITVDVARTITAKHTKQVPNKRTHQRDDVIDRIAVNNDLLDHAIVKWSGVSNGTAAAPCDLEHKLKLPVEVQVALVDRAQVGEVDRTASFRQPA